MVMVANVPHDVDLAALATGMQNGEGDPEALIIKYPSANAGFGTKIPEEMMKRTLLPRVKLAKDSPFYYLVLPPDEKRDDASQLHIPELLGDPSVKELLNGHKYKCPSPYDKIRIPAADNEMVTTFAYITEKSSDATNTSDISSSTCIDFIKSTFAILAGLAQDIHYEARGSEGDIVSLTLASGLKDMSKTFPPKTVFAITGNDSHNVSASASGEARAKHNAAQARMIAYNLSLIRLLVLLYAVPSGPSIDVRIWQLSAQLLALAYGEIITREFVLRIGPCLIQGSIELGLARAGEAPGGSPVGGGSGARANNNPRRKEIPWRKVALGAGLATVAIAPIIALGPIAAALGFGAAGPLAGSIAAAWQSSIGLVEAGSLFAMLTSVGMAGGAATAGAPLLAVVGGTSLAGACAVGSSVAMEMVDGEEVGLVFVFTVTITFLLGPPSQ